MRATPLALSEAVAVMVTAFFVQVMPERVSSGATLSMLPITMLLLVTFPAISTAWK